MAENPEETNQVCDILGVPEADLNLLVPGAKAYFLNTVQEYAQGLLSQSQSIEEMEHTGSGPAEITAAYVGEAKWVLIRRQRQRARSSRWVVFTRIVQVLMSTLVGIGASNFSQTWGAIMCVGGVLGGSIALLVEREISREI
jgi:hypothetical protein